jgi:hypothetical protein
MSRLEPFEEEVHASHTIKVFQDVDAQSPREDDNLGTMTCFHRKYSLGDKHNFSVDEFKDEWLPENKKNLIILPLFLYDHGGITMSIGSFNDRWDSGQIGFIYVTKEKIREEYGWKRLTPKRIDRIKEYLKGEVEEYDQYLTGDIFGFKIEGPYCEDSCWGYYGTKAAIEGATRSIDHCIKRHIEEVKETQAIEGLEGYIILEEYPIKTAA